MAKIAQSTTALVVHKKGERARKKQCQLGYLGALCYVVNVFLLFIHIKFPLWSCWILGTLSPTGFTQRMGQQWPHTTHTHSSTHLQLWIVYLSQFTYVFGTVEGNQTTWRKLGQKQEERAKIHTKANSSLDSNWDCVPPCHPVWTFSFELTLSNRLQTFTCSKAGVFN